MFFAIRLICEIEHCAASAISFCGILAANMAVTVDFCSALNGLGLLRQRRQTGMRLSSVSGAAQIRHSSGKVNEKRAAGIFLMAASAAKARLLALLLLKIHLR